MAKNYGLPEVEFGKIEIFSNPKEIKQILTLQRDPLPEAGMHKDIVFQFIMGRQRMKKLQMFRRKNGSRILGRKEPVASEIAVQSLLSSINQKGEKRM